MLGGWGEQGEYKGEVVDRSTVNATVNSVHRIVWNRYRSQLTNTIPTCLSSLFVSLLSSLFSFLRFSSLLFCSLVLLFSSLLFSSLLFSLPSLLLFRSDLRPHVVYYLPPQDKKPEGFDESMAGTIGVPKMAVFVPEEADDELYFFHRLAQELPELLADRVSVSMFVCHLLNTC